MDMGTIQDVLTKCSKCGYVNRLLPTSDKTENDYSIGDTINTQCLGVEMYGKRNISRNTRCDYEERTIITQSIKNKMI